MASSNKVLGVRFNQDHGCFTCGMESGVRIYNVDPLVEKTYYDAATVGSVVHCEMLYRSNIIAIVPGGSRPKFPDNHLLIYDDLSKKFILEMNFPSSVLGVKLRKDKLVVVLKNQIHVFNFPTPTQKLFKLETKHNPTGLCEMSPLPSSDKQIMVYPGFKNGTVIILDLKSSDQGTSSARNWIAAHQGDVICMTLNEQSTVLATASERGTLIRVWDTTSKNQLVELRRGSDPATISCLNFSSDSEFLCCCSDKGTVHIFAVKDTALNKRMMMPGSGLLGSYGSSLWGLTNFTVPPETSAVCAFGKNNSVYAICQDGSYYKYVFTTDGGCHRETFDIYLDCDDDEEHMLS